MKSSGDPSASYTRASVASTGSSKDSIRKLADDLLRQSLTRKPNTSAEAAASISKTPSVPPSSASITRTRDSKTASSSTADDFLRASLVRGAVSNAGCQPPSYRSNYASVTKPSAASTLVGAPSKVKDRGAISAADAKSRLSELKSEVARANAALPPRGKSDLFKESCSTDLLFLIDTTYSMSSYIEAAKDQVRSIVKEIKDAFLNESNVRIAVVGYKDHDDDPNIEFLDFTTSVTEVHIFLSTLSASGGGDIPEDVLGGIRKAINASWKQQTRCLVHIADAPPHGHTLHDYKEEDDSYYQTASEPHGLTHENLLERLVELKVNYALLRINSSTDRMALKFSKVYSTASAGADAKLHDKNAYHTMIADSLILAKSRAKKTATGTSPLFEEMQLGTTYNALRHLVVSTITASVSRTANRLSLAFSRSKGSTGRAPGPRGFKSSGLAAGLAAIVEDRTVTASSPRTDVPLETAPPCWNTPEWLDQTLAVEGFCLDLSVHDADTLNAMMDNDENIKLGLVKLNIAARSKPFAEGSVRVAAYARPASTTSKFVLKSFKDPEESLANLVEDMRMQALCKAFALEFNGLVKFSQPIDFITTLCLEDKSHASKGNLSLEPFIEGEYVKYNSNGPYVLDDDDNPFNEIAQAFSHFTFERSWGHFLVTDLQGVGNSFTDPAIQTLDPERFKLGPTNLNEEGFKFFFAMHTCKENCRKLGLLSNKEMIMSRNFSFRKTWPAMDPTVCCSNKLCRKIIRLATANKSPAYPSCNWCDGCFPQLKATRTEVTCAAPGSKHKFEVSMFYCESQGEECPSVCEEHREDTTVATVVGGGLWETTRSSDIKEISGRLW
ncbi:Alpha-protein kinase 1 [Tolypocladium ophioglossoides CBS 100239]|uniref:Alpha-protein kinase 1 n=1 Tax=Tolypocladium ophioglossoides (strain CBS 100239) TaxID=1163406 RepID=A0A0L0NBX5_TOLOC|nr:Alpha-protein kinase 1 [Tolypocladium ophioglossoides CBS 100239]